MNAETAARHMIWLAHARSGEMVTPLKLQKLLYYAQGLALGALDRPLFEDALEAWPMGPVARRVYDIFKEFGDRPIPWERGVRAGALGTEDRLVLEQCWREFGRFSASDLVTLSHAEAPWRRARGDRVVGERSNDAIEIGWIREEFRGKRERELARGQPSILELELSAEEARHGELVEWD